MAKIKIDGQEYEFPSLDSITLDESILLERHAGVGLEKLIPGETLPLGAVKGLVVIAVKRARPDVEEREIAERIGKIKLNELQDAFVQEEDGESPPAEALGSDESTSPSGDPGNGAGAPTPDASEPSSTGAPDSATGAASVRAISAV